MGYMDRYGIGGGELAHERFVSVAFGWAQMEVAVGYGKGVACSVHKVGEYHRIDTATNGKQHLLPSGEEVLLLDVCYELL